MSLINRLKKMEAIINEKEAWRIKPAFFRMLNDNFIEYKVKSEDLKHFTEPIEAVVACIELAITCSDIDCNECLDNVTCEAKKHIKERQKKEEAFNEPVNKN